MGIFDDLMNGVDLVERIVRGEGEAVKDELLGQIQRGKGARAATAAAAAETPADAPLAPCDHAPPGYRCLGQHDERGRCLALEALE